ncbi:MAG: hypothetical protein JWP85_2146 [Rhodoglobus sp.]|nr:hypothetical protein [Rhodoglobus sp.]
MDVPEEYESNGRTYQLRQESDTEWAILEDREHHGTLTHNAAGWLAYAPGDEPADEYRTEDWQSTLDSLLDYLR